MDITGFEFDHLTDIGREVVQLLDVFYVMSSMKMIELDWGMIAIFMNNCISL